jgi:four helix bundle protein
MEYGFEKLKIWQLGMDLAESVYSVTKKFPNDEKFGLTSQMRRSAVSIPSNIAEGKGRFHDKEYIQFLYLARASLYELMTQIKLAQRLDYVSEKDSLELQKVCWDISGGTNGLINSLK